MNQQLLNWLPEIKCAIIHIGINNKFPGEQFKKFCLPDDNTAVMLVRNLFQLVKKCPDADFFISLPIYRDYRLVVDLANAITTEKKSCDRYFKQYTGRVRLLDHDLEKPDWEEGTYHYYNSHPNRIGYRKVHQKMLETFRRK